MKKQPGLKILNLISGFLLIFSCATGSSSDSRNTGSPPKWMSDRNSVYPESRYLAETGEGDRLRDAKANAASSIVQVFSTRIQSDSTVQTLYNELTNADKTPISVTRETNINQNITQSADQSLINLRYSDPWTDKMGRVYIIAYLDRLETGNIYRQRIIEIQKRVTELLQQADTLTAPIRRFAVTNAALTHSLTAESMMEQLEIINAPMARASAPSYNPGTVKQKRQNSATALNVFIDIADDNTEALNNTLSDWASRQGFTLSLTQDSANLVILTSIKIKPVKLNNNYENLAWELNLSANNSQRKTVFAFSRQGRSSGISKSAAITRVNTDISKSLSKSLDQEFRSYLSSFIE